MGGYFSTSKSLSVTDYCWHKNYYGNWATASVTVTAGTGGTADYSITVTTSHYNFIQIYLAIDGVAVLNSKDTSGKKTYSYSGSGSIWGGDVSIKLGVGCSQYTDANMSFTEGTLTRTSWSDGSAPSLTITDNGNNTATMSGYLGSNGSNNGITGSTLYWTTNGLQPNGGSSYTTAESMGTTSGGSYSKTINIPSNCSTIWAVTYCSFDYNSTNTGHISQSVKYYKAPSDPGKPVISYTKSRLTIKEPWTISWDAAQAGNSNSPISGYRLRIYKNGLPIDIKNSSGTVVSATVGTDKYYDMSGTSYVINPSSHGILPGDNISIALFAYAINGAGTRLWSGNEENAVISDVYTVQNAGVMRPLVNNKYVEGVVWACIPDSTTDSKIKWVEADIVKTAIKDSPTNSIKWVEGE